MAYQDFAGKRRPSSSAYPEKSSGYVTVDDPITGTGKFQIDNLIGSVAPIFDPTVDYTAGQSVMFHGKLYTFKVNHPAGAWNASHVDVTNMQDYIMHCPSIPSFRTDDVIALYGSDVPAKMSKDDLLTAANYPSLLNALKSRLAVMRGCYYPEDFSTRNPRGDRCGTNVYSCNIGTYFKVPKIQGYKFVVSQSNTLGVTSEYDDTGWLDEDYIGKFVCKYYVINFKKDDESDFTASDLNDISQNLIILSNNVSATDGNNGLVSSTESVHSGFEKFSENDFPFLPFIMVGSVNQSGVSDTNYYYRCYTPIIETAKTDIVVSPSEGFKIWGWAYDEVDSATTLWNTEIHSGETAKIAKGTRYRLVIASDPENTTPANPDTWRTKVKLVSVNTIESKQNKNRSFVGLCNLFPNLEDGDFDPSTYEERARDGRCRSKTIQIAETDLYLTINDGYKFWAMIYNADDSARGQIIGHELKAGDVLHIPKGVKYRLIVASDPEIYTKASTLVYSRQVKIVSLVYEKAADSFNLANVGETKILPLLENGDFNPSTYAERNTQGRCRSAFITEALEDITICVGKGYKFWAMFYDSDGNAIGQTIGREVKFGDSYTFTKGTRYRLVVASDPEIYTKADAFVYSNNVYQLSYVSSRVASLERTDATLEPFAIFGLSSKSRSTMTKRITEFTPYNIGAQSIAIDRVDKLIYRLCGESKTDVDVYDISGTYIKTLTSKGSTGHDNDACFVSGYVYSVSAASITNHMYKWDVANGGSTELDVSAITDNPNGHRRALSGVCQKDSDYLYLVCIDLDLSDPLDVLADDKISVYTYKLSDGTISLVCEIERDLVYCQGCTFVNGLMYISGNTMTTISPSNYTGATIKILSMSSNELLDSIVFSGHYENEGIDYFASNDEIKLMTCFAENGYQADVCKFIPIW